MSLILTPLQQRWLQEIQVATPFLTPYVEKTTIPTVKIAPAKPAEKPEEKVKTIVPVKTSALEGMSLTQLQTHVEQCQGCELHETRTKTVFGTGQIQQPEWFVISTAPSSHEELAGLPMQGKSGELFAAQMHSIGIDNIEQQLYLTQLLKCRFSGKSKPDRQHIEACKAILFRQIALVRPQRLLLLGAKAAALFFGEDQSFEVLREQPQSWSDPQGHILPVVVSYHPASLLLRPHLKAQAWQDLVLMKQIKET